MPWQIRPFEPNDASAVQDLFVRVNRELAPPQWRDEFEQYIALSLREEIGRIAEYYDGTEGRSFWVAVDGERLIGNYGLEPSGPGAFELRRMYVEPSLRRQGLARAMLAHAEQTCVKQGGSELAAQHLRNPDGGDRSVSGVRLSACARGDRSVDIQQDGRPWPAAFPFQQKTDGNFLNSGAGSIDQPILDQTAYLTAPGRVT